MEKISAVHCVTELIHTAKVPNGLPLCAAQMRDSRIQVSDIAIGTEAFG